MLSGGGAAGTVFRVDSHCAEGPCVLVHVSLRRLSVHPAVNGYLASTRGKSMARKGTGHSISRCRGSRLSLASKVLPTLVSRDSNFISLYLAVMGQDLSG